MIPDTEVASTYNRYVYINTPFLPSPPRRSNSPSNASSNMSMSAVSTVLTGAAFGASLVASGVFQPAVIISQLRLQDWHMAQAFLTATAISAYVKKTRPHRFAPVP